MFSRFKNQSSPVLRSLRDRSFRRFHSSLPLAKLRPSLVAKAAAGGTVFGLVLSGLDHKTQSEARKKLQKTSDPKIDFPDNLIERFQHYSKEHYIGQEHKHAEFATGQSPEVMVISCCDSRVLPETIFSASPGEIFVARNVANLVPTRVPGKYEGTWSALEYAVKGLNVKHIIVLGHSSCGGVTAFTSENLNPEHKTLASRDYVGDWVGVIKPAFDRALNGRDIKTCKCDAETIQAVSFESIKASLENLRSCPDIKLAEEQGSLQLHGCFFDIGNASLYVLQDGKFTQIPH